jgi:hypothetical protein
MLPPKTKLGEIFMKIPVVIYAKVVYADEIEENKNKESEDL